MRLNFQVSSHNGVTKEEQPPKLVAVNNLILLVEQTGVEPGESGTLCKLLIVLASQSVPTWNQIISWLKEVETLRRNAV